MAKKIDRVVAGRQGLVTVMVSSLDAELPDTYRVATVDYARAGESHKGRMLSYDRGHCDHHNHLPGALCHCHVEAHPPTEPPCCNFEPVLEAFCERCLTYWVEQGYDYMKIYSVANSATLIEDLAGEDDQ